MLLVLMVETRLKIWTYQHCLLLHYLQPLHRYHYHHPDTTIDSTGGGVVERSIDAVDVVDNCEGDNVTDGTDIWRCFLFNISPTLATPPTVVECIIFVELSFDLLVCIYVRMRFDDFIGVVEDIIDH
jgi:hypothetical protein